MDLSKLSAADQKALAANDLDAISTEGLQLLLGESPQPKKESVLDAPNAFASGALRGAVRLAGIPVDTVANVMDLARATVGTGYQAVTGKPAPRALQLPDRAGVLGSGENMLRALSKNKVTSALVNPGNPDYEGGYAQAIGSALPGAVTPGQAAVSVAGALAGKTVGDATGDPALAITASMLPAVAPRSVSAVAKGAIRGGEAGRAEMVRRMQVLREAGVDRPTLGLASGNGLLGGTETVLQTIPGSMGIFQRARDRAAEGMQRVASDAADTASLNSGRLTAGTAMQRDLRDFHQRQVAPGYVLNNDRAEGVIGTNVPVTVHNAIGQAARLSTPNPGAPQTSATLQQPRIATWRDTLTADAGGAPGYTDAAGLYHPPVPQVGIPYGVVKNLRTSIGAEAASLDNVGRPVQGEIRSMYGALSRDMENAAAQADLQGGRILQTHLPSSASGALTRANRVYSSGRAREERTAPFANNVSPEKAFDAAQRAATSELSAFNALKKSILPATRASIAATVIDDLGTASPGGQAHTGDTFSPATFLTNWNRLGPQGQAALFSGFPNAAEVHRQVATVAEAADMMRGNSRHWANPSGTAANQSGREMLRGLGIGVPAALAGLGSWGVPLGVGATAGMTRGMSRALTDPRVADWASRRTPQLSDSDIGALSRMLISSGELDQK